MIEDLKIFISADTKLAEQQINDNLGKQKPKINVEIERQKLEQEFSTIQNRIKQIKLDKKAFKIDDIKLLKAEVESLAAKAKALNFIESTNGIAELLKNIEKAHRQLNKLIKSGDDTNKVFGAIDIVVGNIATSLLKKGLTALKQMTVEGAKLNQQLDYANAKIQTISLASRAELNHNIWGIAKDTGIDPLELKTGLYELVSAMGDTQKKYEVLKISNKLAVTGFTTTKQAIDGLTTVLNAYGLEAQEAERIANVFVRTQKVGKITVQEFSESLYKTVPVAKELDITIEEIGASIALITSKGSKGEVAQTKMGAFMYELLDVGSDLNKLFETIAGQSFNNFMNNGGSFIGAIEKLKAYSNLSGEKIENLLGRKEAKSFYLEVSGDISGYKEKLNAIKAGNNELEKNMNNIQAITQKRLERATIFWVEFKNNIGSILTDINVYIADFITGFNEQDFFKNKNLNDTKESIEKIEFLFKKLAKGQELNKQELKSFNEELLKLSVLSPNLYNTLIDNGNNYAKVLENLNNKQKELNSETQKMKLSELNKQKEKLEQEKKIIQNKIHGGNSLTSPLQKATMGVLKPKEKAELAENLKLYEDIKIKIIDINKKIDDLKNHKEKPSENIAAFTSSHKPLKDSEIQEIKKAIISSFEKILYSPNKEQTLKNITELQEKLKNNNYIDSTNWNNELKNIEKTGKNKKIDIKNKFNENFFKADDKIRKDIFDNYLNELELLNEKVELEKMELEKRKLLSSILTETDMNRISEVLEQVENINLEIKEKKADLKINSANFDLKKSELFKRDIETSFNKKNDEIKSNENIKISKVKEKYLKELIELEKNFSLERFNILKEEREKEIQLIKNQSKIEFLKNENHKLNALNPKENAHKIQNNNAIIQSIEIESKTDNITEDLIKVQDQLTKKTEKMIDSLNNLSNLFKTLSVNGGGKHAGITAGLLDVGKTILSTDMGKDLISKLPIEADTLKNLNDKLSIGGAIFTGGSLITSLFGGDDKDQLIGGLTGGIGGIFSAQKTKKKKKKAKKEKKKYEEAQRKLEQGKIEGKYQFDTVMDLFYEELEKSGLHTKIDMLDKVGKNTDYVNIKTALEGARRGEDGLSLSVLKELMPHMSEQEIFDWFKATTGGAVLNGDVISTGFGKYGAIDLGSITQQITETNRELEKDLKDKIKNIIDFSADTISGIVKNGFGEGIDDLGNNLEKAIANSLKNAFLNTEIAKGLFNGLSDKVSDLITQMFKTDKNIGINLDIGKLEDLTFQEYINIIKKYLELGNERLIDIFKELGLSLDNLNNTIDKADKNSKNTVQGMATNLWLQNLNKYNHMPLEQLLNNSNYEIFKSISKTTELYNSLNNNNNNNNKLKLIESNIITQLKHDLKNLKVEVPAFEIDNHLKIQLDGKELEKKIVKTLQTQTLKHNRNKLSIIRG